MNKVSQRGAARNATAYYSRMRVRSTTSCCRTERRDIDCLVCCFWRCCWPLCAELCFRSSRPARFPPSFVTHFPMFALSSPLSVLSATVGPGLPRLATTNHATSHKFPLPPARNHPRHPPSISTICWGRFGPWCSQRSAPLWGVWRPLPPRPPLRWLPQLRLPQLRQVGGR